MSLTGKLRSLLKPRILRKKKTVSSMAPRLSSETGFEPFSVECRDPGKMERILIDNSDTLFRNFSVRDKIMIKINLNTADKYPASTNVSTLRSMVSGLEKLGFRDVTVADCCSNKSLPTRKVAKSLGLLSEEFGHVKFLFFDEAKWTMIPVEGEFLESVTFPEDVFRFDKIIHLANMKSHRLAGFSFCMKLSVGYLHPMERYEIHRDNLQEKVAEINLAVEADLSVIDAMKVFVTGGPASGRVENGGRIIFGSSPLKTDTFAYGYFSELKIKYGCVEEFEPDCQKARQIMHGVKMGLRNT